MCRMYRITKQRTSSFISNYHILFVTTVDKNNKKLKLYLFCAKWSVALRIQYNLGMFSNVVLKRKFRPMKEKVI